MDELILRSLRGETNELDERVLLKWRRSSADNEAHYQQLGRVWELEPVTLPSGSPPPPPSAEAILREAASRRVAALPLHRRLVRVHGRWLRAAMASAAMLVLGFGLAQLRTSTDTVDAFGAEELATGPGETVTVTLSDGSFARLAPNSRLRITDQGVGREVWLDGRGYFAVAEDPSRPFTVRTAVGDAIALGTRFEVRVQQDQLRLAVSEGRVLLAAGQDALELNEGEVSHVRSGEGPSVVKVEEIHELLEWPGGLLVFQSTPLRQVVVELERHFDVRFEITDAEIAGRVVTGWFGDETLDEVLTAVCRATQTRCSMEAKRVIVTRGLID